MRWSPPRGWSLTGGVLAVILLGTSLARAGDEKEDLRQLIEMQSRALEQMNRQLQEQAKTLEQQSQEIERLKSSLSSIPPAPTTPAGESAVKKIVSDYLDDQEKKKQEAKAAKEECKETGKDLTLKTSWNNGFVAQTEDKKFRIHLGGLFDFDSGWYSASPTVENVLLPPGLRQGSDLRRARFTTEGTCWELMDWKLDIDFSRASDDRKFSDAPNASVNLLDVWVGFHDLPYLGTVRFGHQKETISFSNATSASNTPFMERSLPFDALEDGFNRGNGVTASRTYCDELLYSWLGLFQTDTRKQAFHIDKTAKLALDGRVCIVPFNREDEHEWLNIGIAGSLRANPSESDSTLGLTLPFDRTTVVPLIRTGSSFQIPNLIDTGNYFSNDGTQVFCLCYNQVCGPLTLSATYDAQYTANAYAGALPRANGMVPVGIFPLGNLYFDGYSFELLCFLTHGDSRPLDLKTHGYGRIRPVENFFVFRDPCTGVYGHGLGAWEIGLRYDHINVKNGELLALSKGGELDAITFGLNWYWNPNAKMMLNYVYTTGLFGNATLVESAFHSLGMRVHYDF